MRFYSSFWVSLGVGCGLFLLPLVISTPGTHHSLQLPTALPFLSFSLQLFSFYNSCFLSLSRISIPILSFCVSLFLLLSFLLLIHSPIIFLYFFFNFLDLGSALFPDYRLQTQVFFLSYFYFIFFWIFGIWVILN